MMTTVDRIKQLCSEMGVSIARLEKMCGFSNGYLGQLKKGVLPTDRLYKVAEYLGVSPEYLFTGADAPATPSRYLESIALIEQNWDRDRFSACYDLMKSLYLLDHPEDKEKIC